MSATTVPPEFSKILNDFIKDLYTTFPEYIPFIEKWRKPDSSFQYIQNVEERNLAIEKSNKTSDEFIFKFCSKKYPPRFFDFLYKNEDIFKEDSEIDTEFLPHVYFKSLWQCDITEQTRETMWKYLQLILFTITGMVKPDFNNIQVNEDEFKEKLEETLGQIQEYFQSNSASASASSSSSATFSSESEMDENIAGLLGGKLGNLAKEIAEETAGDLNLDMENVTDMNDVFQKLFKNPGKLMGLVKNVSDRLDVKLKDGDINEKELMSEVGDLMSKMKHMPGMDNLHSMLGKMGMPGQESIKQRMGPPRPTAPTRPTAPMPSSTKKPKTTHQTPEQTREQKHMDALTDAELEKIFNEVDKPVKIAREKKHKK
jgi:hypothetical protein